jgi:hypothetical protein
MKQPRRTWKARRHERFETGTRVISECISMPGKALAFAATERKFLLQLQTLALRYFLDNQTADGLILDRQRNFGPLRAEGWCSTATTGMGLIALALASVEPFQLLSRSEAIERVEVALTAARDRLPHTWGVLPHFTDSRTGSAVGFDQRSTIDTGWLIAGALWAAEFLQDNNLKQIAQHLYQRINWRFWTSGHESRTPGLIHHGTDVEGRFLPCAWDRLNGETVFLYVLAAGADHARAWPAEYWPRLQTWYGAVAGLRFASADLGLFVFQYGLDLLDLTSWRNPTGCDLSLEAALAAEANYRHCRSHADRFGTYRIYWGLSAGDGPGDHPATDIYRCYAPAEPLDGTAHLTATVASVAHRPTLVLEQLERASRENRAAALGRYGFSNINLDRGWVGRDMVGIDAGAAVLALDNVLADNRIRQTFHRLPCVIHGLRRLGFATQNQPGTRIPRQAA